MSGRIDNVYSGSLSSTWENTTYTNHAAGIAATYYSNDIFLVIAGSSPTTFWTGDGTTATYSDSENAVPEVSIMYSTTRRKLLDPITCIAQAYLTDLVVHVIASIFIDDDVLEAVEATCGFVSLINDIFGCLFTNPPANCEDDGLFTGLCIAGNALV